MLLALSFAWTLQCAAQTSTPPAPPPSNVNKPNVHWLFGAFVTKSTPLVTLSGKERAKLYVVQAFTNPGVYIRSGFFATIDQVNNEPSEWGGGASGFGKRFASHQGQLVVQYSMSSLGNAVVGYEPRYDQCKCDGTWKRMRHAIVRNFMTYNRTEKELRPQMMLYGAAFGAGAVSSVWKPDRFHPLSQGANGVLNQAAWGVLSNMFAEFYPEIKRTLKFP